MFFLRQKMWRFQSVRFKPIIILHNPVRRYSTNGNSHEMICSVSALLITKQLLMFNCGFEQFNYLWACSSGLNLSKALLRLKCVNSSAKPSTSTYWAAVIVRKDLRSVKMHYIKSLLVKASLDIRQTNRFQLDSRKHVSMCFMSSTLHHPIISRLIKPSIFSSLIIMFRNTSHYGGEM